MSELFYSSGQAAKELGVSQAHLRALCAAGAIAARSTSGGQLRVPQEEVVRVKKEGLPTLPRPLPDSDSTQAGRRFPPGPGSRLTVERSDVLIHSNENIALLENEIKALDLERQKEEALDFFRQRDQEEADRQAAQYLDEEKKRAEARAERERKLWLKRWEHYGMRAVPLGAPPDIRLAVHEGIRARLGNLHPMPVERVTKRLVDAVVQSIVAPWRYKNEIAQILVDVRDSWLPSWAQGTSEVSQLQIQAVWAAAEAIDTHTYGTSIQQLRAAARRAVEPILNALNHTETCRKVLNSVRLQIDGATDAERRAAEEGVANVLSKVAIGTSRMAMEGARDVTLAPLKKAIAEREGRQRADLERKLEEQRRIRDIDARLDRGLNHILDYLKELEADDEIEFSGFSDRWHLYENLKTRIRPILRQELERRAEVTDAQLFRRVGELVDETINEFLDTD